MYGNRNIAQRVFYRFLRIFLSLFWLAFIIIGVTNCVAKTYLYPLKYKELIVETADVYGLEQALVFAIVNVESGFDKNAESRAGAIGLMQITPETAKYIADLQGITKYDLKNERTNVNFGCFYLKYLLQRFHNLDTSIVAYNAGEGNVRLWLNNPTYSDDKITLKFIPFSESREYIKKIKETFTKYKKLYGNILDK